MKKDKLSVVLTGGGTGGHIYPAIAIAGGIKDVFPKAEITFVGTSKGLEREIVPHSGYPIKFISAVGMERKISLKIFSTLRESFVGVGQAAKLLKALKPDVVIGTGGYVSGPVVLAAAMMSIPTAIHEQNAYPGITNKLLNPLVSKVFLTFPEAQNRFKRKNNLVISGLPVRDEIIYANREDALEALGIAPGTFVLVVVGGSRGARSINEAMNTVYRKFRGQKNVHIIHVTGETDYQATLERMRLEGLNTDSNLTIHPYMHDIKNALAAANLIVGRAGASFLSELLVQGIPSILIPYPYASENHQHFNAISLVNAGAAKLIEDKNLNGEILVQSILEIMHNDNKRDAMHKAALKLAKSDALKVIVREIFKLTCIAHN